jgi:hypothetical protein
MFREIGWVAQRTGSRAAAALDADLVVARHREGRQRACVYGQEGVHAVASGHHRRRGNFYFPPRLQLL